METSATIGKLAEALSKAQGVIEGAKKSADNPFFKSKYADLSEVWDACRKPLSDNGLSVVQTSDFLPEHPDMVCIETILCHSSGEWMKGRLAVKPVKSDPQSVGSCITYIRRYSLQSMVGIAPEDDDGNGASLPTGKTEDNKKSAPKTEKPKSESAPLICMAIIKEVTHKDGETNGKAWRRYGIQDGNDAWYSTFSKSVVDMANTALNSGDVVALHYTEGEKSRTLINVEFFPKSEAA